MLFAAPDALGSVCGVQVLDGYGLRPFAVSGMVSRSPLAVQEAFAQTGVTHMSREQLCDPEVVAAHIRPLVRSGDAARRAAA